VRRQKRYPSHATPTSIRVAFDIPVELHDCLRVVCAVTGFHPEAIMQAALRTAIARLNAESDALDGWGTARTSGRSARWALLRTSSEPLHATERNKPFATRPERANAGRCGC
jgi:hypothetical protein